MKTFAKFRATLCVAIGVAAIAAPADAALLWMLLLGGFGLLGAASRCRRSAIVFA